MSLKFKTWIEQFCCLIFRGKLLQWVILSIFIRELLKVTFTCQCSSLFSVFQRGEKHSQHHFGTRNFVEISKMVACAYPIRIFTFSVLFRQSVCHNVRSWLATRSPILWHFDSFVLPTQIHDSLSFLRSRFETWPKCFDTKWSIASYHLVGSVLKIYVPITFPLAHSRGVKIFVFRWFLLFDSDFCFWDLKNFCRHKRWHNANTVNTNIFKSNS